MKTKKEVAESISKRIAELKENINTAKMVGDWSMVAMYEQQLKVRESELGIFK